MDDYYYGLWCIFGCSLGTEPAPENALLHRKTGNHVCCLRTGSFLCTEYTDEIYIRCSFGVYDECRCTQEDRVKNITGGEFLTVRCNECNSYIFLGEKRKEESIWRKRAISKENALKAASSAPCAFTNNTTEER